MCVYILAIKEARVIHLKHKNLRINFCVVSGKFKFKKEKGKNVKFLIITKRTFCCIF